MDPYSSPYIIPNNSPHSPFPHSLLRTRQFRLDIRRMRKHPNRTKEPCVFVVERGGSGKASFQLHGFWLE